MSVNIGGDARDMNYRYKMPILQTKIEGRGNGIKTVIVNMVEIAKSLHIHPAYPTKFFGIELGAQSKFNVATERAIVNGAHQAGDLAKLLEKFIAQFILCPNCRLPELKMTIKTSSIKYECAACGASGQIKTAHRLVGYMTRNPPKSLTTDAKEGEKKKKKKGRSGAGEAGEAGEDDDAEQLDEAGAALVAAASSSAMPGGGDESDGEVKEKEKEKKPKKTKEEKEAKKARKEAKRLKKEAKKAKKKAKSKEEKASESEEDESSDEEQEESKEADKEDAAAVAAAAAAPAKEKKEKKPVKDSDDSESDDDDDDDGDEWHTDTSKAAVRKRQEAEFAEMVHSAAKEVEEIVLAAKADNKGDSAVTVLKIFLASASRSPVEIAAELRRLAMSRGLDETQKMKVLLEAIVDLAQPKSVVEQFKSKAELLRYFTSGAAATASAVSPGGENRNAALTLLTCIEDLVGVVERQLLPYLALLLKQLYEDDVLEEATLISWHDAPPESSWLVNREVAAEVRERAKPFIQWLKTAEEESEDEE